MIRKKTLFLAIFITIVLTSVVFYPTLKNGFTNFDDDVYVTKNPNIRDLSLESIKNIFTTSHTSLYVPIVILSYSIEYHFFELDPFYYHLDNLILHIINSLLVFWLIYLLTGSVFSSFLVTILFAIHPLKVESVAWITERKDLLYSLFFLLSIITYIKYKASGSKKILYYSSLAFFSFSLLAKPMALVLPAILLLVDYYQKGKINKKDLIAQIPFLQLGILFSYITFFVLQSEKTSSKLDFLYNFTNLLGMIPFYLYKLIWPIRLTARYPNHISEIFEQPYLFILLCFIIIALVFYSFRKYKKDIVFSSGFFIVCLMPVAPILINGYPNCDRYTYIASIGFFFFFVRILEKIIKKKHTSSPIIISSIILFLFLIFGGFSWLTWNQSKVWRNGFTLWDSSLKNYESPLAYNNRGVFNYNQKKFNQAFSDFTQAIRLKPNSSAYYLNRGQTLNSLNQPAKAIIDLSQAIKLKPNRWLHYYHRGLSFSNLNLLTKAIKDFKIVLYLNPNFLPAFKKIEELQKRQLRLHVHHN